MPRRSGLSRAHDAFADHRPRENSEQFILQLQEELNRRPYGTLIAGSDSSLLAISQMRESVETLTKLGLPSSLIVERAMHRQLLTAAAEEVGLPSATSIRCADVQQALAAAEKLGFPVALKSLDAAQPAARTIESAPKGQVVSSAAELAEAAAQFDGGMLLQRWVAGEVISFGGVFAEERLLGVAVSRYIRMWPTRSGSVTFSQAISPPAGLLDAVRKLMLVIGWEGIFELELIQSAPQTFTPIDLIPGPTAQWPWPMQRVRRWRRSGAIGCSGARQHMGRFRCESQRPWWQRQARAIAGRTETSEI